MNFKPIIDIHVHSHYSLLDGVSSPKDIVQKAKEWGSPAIALTDHGTMAGVFEFYSECKKNNIKPLIGCEFYFKEKLKDGNNKHRYYHGLFIAMNEVGLRNLFYLSSIGGRAGHFEFNRPVVSFREVLDNSEGLIYSTGCMDGIIGAAKNTAYEESNRLVEMFKAVFKDRMYIEISFAKVVRDWNRETRDFNNRPTKTYQFGNMKCKTNCLQELHNKRALHMAFKHNLPIVMGSDGHMIDPSFKPIQDLLIKSSPTNKNGWHFGQIHSMLSSDEAWKAFQLNHPYIPEIIFKTALDNNYKISERVENYTLDFSTLIPKFPSHTHPLYKKGMTQKDLMLAIIVKLGKLPNDPKYYNRLKEEIAVICDNGVTDYTDYFLILHDIAKAAQRMNVGMGPARGSAGGCLLSYLLDITAIDPIQFDLSFARFLNAGRLKAGHPPDIDLDFSDREPIVDYLFTKYGEDYMAMVGTFQTIKTKMALKAIVKYLANDGKLINADPIHKICKTIETAPQYFSSELDFLEGFVDEDGVEHEGHLAKNPQLQTFFKKNEYIKGIPIKTYDILKKLLEKPRYQSKHAGGVVIVPKKIDYTIPTKYYNKKKCTQIDFKTLEKVGGLKIDILGVNTLNFIWGAVKSIQVNHNVKLDPWHLPQDNKVFAQLTKGDTASVFQFDTDTVRPFLNKIPVNSLMDLALITAVARPGGLKSTLEDKRSVAQHYIWRSTNKEPVRFIDPLLKPILGETYGLCIFQEQIQKIFEIVGGFNSTESDDARRAIGKKQLQTLLSIKSKLFENAKIKFGWSLDKCNTLWNSFIGAANYAFNKSHAVAYATIGYACAYIKYYYPLEWWSSVLSNVDSDKMKQYLPFIKDKIILPHVNRPLIKWAINNGQLIAPLSLIHNVGNIAIIEIQKAIKSGAFQSFDDFYNRVNKTKVNKAIMTNLVIAGCFDGLPLRLYGESVVDQPHKVIEHLYSLRTTKKKQEKIPLEYANLDNRLTKSALKVQLLPLASANYVQEFMDAIKKHPKYKYVRNQHTLKLYPIIEDFNALMADNHGVALVGLITKKETIYYNDKKTNQKLSAIRITIENDNTSMSFMLWPNKLNKKVKEDFQIGNLMAVFGYPKVSKFYKNKMDLDYFSHLVLLLK